MTLKEKLRRLRKHRKWRQEDLARRIGSTKMSVSRWERGEAKPRMDQLQKLARAFGISLSNLDSKMPKRLAAVEDRVFQLFETTGKGKAQEWGDFEAAVD